ncbi:MAG: hypothetical protein QM765_41695 [Myxococcales bacterium]
MASTFLSSKIAQAILRLEAPSPLLWPLLEPRITAPILVAPIVCYLAGLLVEGPRWTIAATTVVALQASIGLIAAVTVHPEVALNASALGISVVAGGIGVLLSGLAIGLAQRRPSAPSGPAPTNAPATSGPVSTGEDKPQT